MKKVILTLAIIATSVFAFGANEAQIDSMVIINTDYGNIVLKLYNETPLHRDNFMKLVRNKFYDSLLFHRVIKDFMIQGGDPQSKRAKPDAMLGNGENGYTIPAEFNTKFTHKKGALAGARMGDNVNPQKSSSGCQFYIVQGRKFEEAELVGAENNINNQMKQGIFTQYINSPANAALKNTMIRIQKNQNQDSLKIMNDIFTKYVEAESAKMKPFQYSAEQKKDYATIGGTPHLDMGYTVFGEVITGLEIIDKIGMVEKGTADRPKVDVRMTVEVLTSKQWAEMNKTKK
jgi:peptidyl-prolyl cis-trans isomerase B (cyclophilin B)